MQKVVLSSFPLLVRQVSDIQQEVPLLPTRFNRGGVRYGTKLLGSVSPMFDMAMPIADALAVLKLRCAEYESGGALILASDLNEIADIFDSCVLVDTPAWKRALHEARSEVEGRTDVPLERALLALAEESQKLASDRLAAAVAGGR